jgi:hypothetical protein
MTSDIRGSATGSQFSGHDAVYAWAADMNGGVEAGNDGTVTTIHRRTLAATGTTSVKADLPIGADWRAVRIAWGYVYEGAGSAGQEWVPQVRYSLYYPLLGGTATSLTMTTVAIPAIDASGATAGSSGYAIPSAVSAIATPVDGFLGTSPIMHVCVDRLGDNASDDFGSGVSITTITLTRVD